MHNTLRLAAALLGCLLAPLLAVRSAAQSQSAAAQANPPAAGEHIPPNFVPAGKEMYA